MLSKIAVASTRSFHTFRSHSLYKEGQFSVYSTATLYVPHGTKEMYETTEGWNQFENIVEMDAPEGIEIDEVNFPDEIFRQFVLDNCDTDKNGFLTEDEISAVLQMHVNGMSITDLKGIEYFTALNALDCQGNQLTSLDVSNNSQLISLECSSNQLSTLDVSNNPNLVELDCIWNQLTALHVSKYSSLSLVKCLMNQIKGEAMDTLVAHLPETGGKLYVIDTARDEQHVITKMQVAAAKEKGWICYTNNGEEYEGSEDIVTFTALTEEGVEVTYRVLSEADKTCQVGVWTEVHFNVPIESAVSTSTTGTVTIPEEVYGYRVIAVGADAFIASGITKIRLPESIVEIKESAFSGCSSLVDIHLPNSLTIIGDRAFSWCTSLESITFPSGVTYIGDGSFQTCKSLRIINSEITEPYEIVEWVFMCWDDETGSVVDYPIYTDAVLYVPAGTKVKYEATPGWNLFQHIVEMDIEPVEDGQTVDFAEDIDEDTNLDGNVVGDIFYNISDEDGSYDEEEGCIVVTTPTDDDTMSQLEGQDIFGEDFKDVFTGIVFKVAPGKGSVRIEAQTTGSMVLKVKIGDSEPITKNLEDKQKITIPYNVEEETYVYVYGGNNASQAKGMRKADANDGELRIYGIEVESNTTPTDIDGINQATITEHRYYNLNGQQVNAPQKGLYITDGKKVVVK